MAQDLNPNKVRSLLEALPRAFYSKPPEAQAQAVGQALLYAFETIQRLEARINELETAEKARTQGNEGQSVADVR